MNAKQYANLSSVKAATLAIGVATKEVLELRKIPTEFADIQSECIGTGFFITSDGYFMTAWHVYNLCEKLCRSGEKRPVVITVDTIAEPFRINTVPIGQMARVMLGEHNKGYAGPADLDIAIGKVKGIARNIPYLQVKESKSNIYDEIAMCGYPYGNQSLDLSRRYFGLRFSPIIQVGRISGFMPTDTAPNPYGLQTDIIGTGGSSGSPIMDTSARKVVGIAQQVIQSSVVVNSSPIGNVNLGLVYGVSNHVLYGIYKNAQDFLEREKGERKQYTMLGSGFEHITFSRNR